MSDNLHPLLRRTARRDRVVHPWLALRTLLPAAIVLLLLVIA